LDPFAGVLYICQEPHLLFLKINLGFVGIPPLLFLFFFLQGVFAALPAGQQQWLAANISA